MITWTPVEEYVQPDLSIPEVKQVPTLFWAKGVGPVLGHLKDGDLWSRTSRRATRLRLTHFSRIRPPTQKPA